MIAVYIINRLPTPVLANKAPNEILYNQPVDYDSMKAFGCLVLASNSANKMDKFTARAVPCVFLGYPPGQKGYKLLDLSTKQVFVSRDTVFHETIFPLNLTTSKPYLQPLSIAMPHTEPTVIATDDMFVCEPSHTPDTSEPQIAPSLTLDSTPSPPPVVAQRKSSRILKQPIWLEDYVHNLQQPHSANIAQVTDQQVHTEFKCFLASLTTSHDPISYKTAVQQKNWVDAMNKELAALEENQT